MYKVANGRTETSSEKSLWAVLEEMGKRLTRIEAALRCSAAEEDADGAFTFGEGKVSRKRFAYVGKGDDFVRISPRELKLLEMFACHPNEVLARDMLLSRLWGIDFYGNTRTLDQHIARLRQKLGTDGECIVTINRVGYSYQPAKVHPGG